MIPKVDHYIGRKFNGIQKSQTDAVYQWAVELEGNILIRNYDELRDEPSGDPTGLSLINVNYTVDNTELVFGNYNPDGTPNYGPSVIFPATEYTISGPDIDEIKPRIDHTPPTPEDPSPDRVASGPE